MQVLERPARLSLTDILVVTELPPWADSAVPYALGLAEEHGARMHVVHGAAADIFENAMPRCAGRFRNSWRDMLLRATGRQMLAKKQATASTLRASLEPQDFDLAVVSAGKAASELLQAADCPLVVLGPAIPAGEPPRSKPATILYATDFSPQALAAAQHAFSWAQEYEAWLTMLHVVEGVDMPTADERARLEEPFRKWMAELVPAELPLWCEVEQQVMFGSAAPCIVAVARDLQADLIVIGLSGLDGAEPAIPGKTALGIISQAECPVLVVRDYMRKRGSLEIASDLRSHSLATRAA